MPQAPYNAAYTRRHGFPGDATAYAKIQSTSMAFTPIGSAAPVTMPLLPKAIQELFTLDYGRMNATLGVELPFTTAVIQTTIPLGYIDPATEIFQETATVATKIGTAGDGTQLWKFTHNGVDSHGLHFHLFNVQLVNRVGWDGAIKPPNPNELGWKDTVVMNPLEDIVVAFRPFDQILPFAVPNSIRPFDVTQADRRHDGIHQR